MKRLGQGKRAFGMALVLVFVAGCGAQSSQGASSNLMPARLNLMHGQAHQSSASAGDLLYVLTGKNVTVVSISTWQIIGSIAGYEAGGICSDPTTGDIFLPQDDDTILEYAHGGTTPIATLNGPKGYHDLQECAVDPTTHNLATTSQFGPSEGSNSVIIVFPGEQNSPMVYQKKKIHTLVEGAYDDLGNFYVDAINDNGKFFIGELKAGQSQISLIRLKASHTVAKLQWDGTYLVGAVPNQGLGSIAYQLQISGGAATVAGTVRFSKSGLSGFWISSGTYYQAFGKVPHRKNEALGAWPYPKGGKASATLYGIVHGNGQILDLTVSVAPSRR